MLPLIITLLVVVTSPDPPPELSTNRALEPVTTALTLPGDWAVEGPAANRPARRAGGRGADGRVLHGADS